VSVDLEVAGLTAGYGEMVVLDDVSFSVAAGRTLAVLGRNGVGKTTLLATLMGYTNRRAGTIRLGDRSIETLPTHLRVSAGLGYVPQERLIFPSLTAEENLTVAARPGGMPIAHVYELFPGVAARRAANGNRLSGGEQQMLAIGRALVGGPKVLLLDEPMEGLAPIVIESLYAALERLRSESSLTILLVEQKVELALSLADEAIVLDRGRIAHRRKAAELLGDHDMQARLLGMGKGEADAAMNASGA
jgi:branched-chain amino acid transport system ATP-binding protein